MTNKPNHNKPNPYNYEPDHNETIRELLAIIHDLVINVYEDVSIDEMSKHLISSLNEATIALETTTR